MWRRDGGDREESSVGPDGGPLVALSSNPVTHAVDCHLYRASALRRSESVASTVSVTVRRSVRSSRRSKSRSTPSTTARSAARTRSSARLSASGSASRATRRLRAAPTCSTRRRPRPCARRWRVSASPRRTSKQSLSVWLRLRRAPFAFAREDYHGENLLKTCNDTLTIVWLSLFEPVLLSIPFLKYRFSRRVNFCSGAERISTHPAVFHIQNNRVLHPKDLAVVSIQEDRFCIQKISSVSRKIGCTSQRSCCLPHPRKSVLSSSKCRFCALKFLL
jgi:hypothetical protein